MGIYLDYESYGARLGNDIHIANRSAFFRVLRSRLDGAGNGDFHEGSIRLRKIMLVTPAQAEFEDLSWREGYTRQTRIGHSSGSEKCTGPDAVANGTNNQRNEVALHYSPILNLRLPAETIQQVSLYEAPIQYRHWERFKAASVHGLPSHERMTPVDGEDHFILPDVHALPRFVNASALEYREVKGPIVELMRNFVGTALDGIHGYSRICSVECGHQRRKKRQAEHGRNADRDIAAKQIGRVSQFALEGVQLLKDASSPRQQQSSFYGGHDSSRLANEQRSAEILLQSLHGDAEYQLNNVKRFGCFGEAAMLRDRIAVAECLQIERRSHGRSRVDSVRYALRSTPTGDHRRKRKYLRMHSKLSIADIVKNGFLLLYLSSSINAPIRKEQQAISERRKSENRVPWATLAGANRGRYGPYASPG